MAKTETPVGRFLVNEVRIIKSGKQSLQAELDWGYFNGYTLREVVAAGKNDWILVVWDRERS